MKTTTLHWKRMALPVLLVLLLSAVGLTKAMAQTFTVGNLNYFLNDDGVSVTVIGHVDGSNATGELVIPESVNYYSATYTVTLIADNAFSGCSGLTGSLIIPETITSIGANAFNGCSGFTGDLTIPNSVTYIGTSAFSSCSGFIGALTIGTSLSKTGRTVFSNCNFTTLNYNAVSCYLMDVHVYIGALISIYEGSWNGSFWYNQYSSYYHWLSGCNSFVNLNIGDGVTKLPYCFLDGCSSFTGNLVIPESVTTIEWNAFNGCSGFTGSLTIPQSVTTLDNNAFANCNGFTALNFNAANCTSMSSSWLENVTSLTSLSIGENVQRIPDEFVTGKSSILGSLTIPNSVSYIGANAFSSCSGLTGTLTLGQSVSQIGNSAFFDACAGFTSFNVLAEVPPTLGNNVFISADYGMPVLVLCGSLNAYQNASGWNVFTNIQEPIPCMWEITATANPAEGGTISGAGTYEQGTTCTLTATPNEDYIFVNWTEDGEEVSTEASYSFTITGNRNLVANFRYIRYEITALAIPEAGGTISGTGSYLEGQTCTLIATPNDGYYFVNWKEDGIEVSTEAEYSFTVEGNRNLEVRFERPTFTITATVNPSYAGEISGINNGTIDFENGEIPIGWINDATYPWTVVSDAYPGYNGTYCIKSGNGGIASSTSSISAIVNYSEDGFVSFLAGCWGEGSNDSYDWDKCRFYIDGSIMIDYGAHQVWENVSFDVSAGNHTFTWTYKKDGSVNSEGDAFFIDDVTFTGATSAGTAFYYYSGETCALTATSTSDDFAFVNWTENGEVVSTDTLYSFTVTGDRNLVANFVQVRFDITATANPEEGGMVEGAGIYMLDETCTLTATPNEDYVFVNWTEDGEEVSAEASYSFTVASDRNLVANFRNIRYNVLVAIQPVIGGTVTVPEAGRTMEDQHFDFDNGMQGWSVIDANNDGYTWTLTSAIPSTWTYYSSQSPDWYHSASNAFCSGSYINGVGALTPDEFLISPMVNLGNNSQVSFWVAAADASYAADHFGVFVSRTGTNPSDFVSVQEWTLTAKSGNRAGNPSATRDGENLRLGSWYYLTVDLSNYAGLAYIAFRHYNCYDQYIMCLDDITIANTEVFGFESYSYLEGETCTLTAVPNEGWMFYRWEENGEEISIDAEYSFTVTSNRNLVARFKNPNTIDFADPNVEAICLNHWDTDGDGFLSYDEAAAVTDLGNTFQGNTQITSFAELQYFTGLTYINSQAFYNCSNLTSVVIPNSVNNIDWYAFYGCESLTEFTVPESVTYLDWWVLGHCYSLEVVNYNAVNASINDRWIGDCPSLTTVNIGENVQTIPGNAFRDCSSLTSVVFSESVTTIGEFAFYGCSGLTGELTIPESVSYIGGAAFAGTSYNTLNYNAINCNSLQWYGGYDGWEGYVSCLVGLDSLTTLNIGEYVQSIPTYAFKDFSSCIGSLMIPNSVTFIGGSAFENCTGFTGELVLPDSLITVRGSAFNNCSGLSGTLTIPETVTSIESSAFGNTAITSIVFNAVDCNEMGYLHWLNSDYNDIRFESAFAGCSNISAITIGNGVRVIPDGAFKDIIINTNSFIIPNSVETIGDYAFDNVGISGTLIIPNSITGIGSYAFSNNSITTVDFNATNCTYIGNGWNWDDGVDIAVSTFYNCNDFTTLNIGDQVENIPAYAFVNCTNLTGNLSLPNSLVSIGECAFEGCIGFSGNLVIPNSVETIDHNAFTGCTGLSGTLTIGESATSINGNAFRNTLFSTMNYNAIDCIIGGLFWDQWHYSQYFEYNSFMDMPYLTTLNIGNNVESISQNAFKNLTTLTGPLTLPNSLTTIGDQAFYNCYGFESIVMGNSVETIGSEAFRNCGGLRGELTLPETLLSVGPSAFAGCNEISTVNYKAVNCETMGNASENVFADCLSLAHIRIGADVESIPNYAFKPCFLITDMSVAAEVPPTIYASTFGTVSRNIPVSVPLGSSPAYRTAQYWEEFFHITEDYSSSPYSYHWNVNVHQFGDNMTVTGIIQIDGEEQAVPYLEIGAFCDGECRGRQLLTYYPQVDRYLVFLMLYGEEGDMFTFKLYNHETNEESTAGCAAIVTFEANAIMGSFMEPFVFNFTDMQLTTFSEGYTWWSTYIEQEGVDGLEMLENGLGGNGVSIRSQGSGYIDYYGAEYGWWGSLSSINNESSYKVVTNAPCVVSMAGTPAVPSEHPITLDYGWTWMGYVPSMAMDINTALEGMEATVGDMVKSQNGYSEYYAGYGWFGSLNTVEPGMGLMYYSTNVDLVTFTYPDNGRGGELKANLTSEHNHWKPNVYAYPDNMTVMAVVELNDEELGNENYELAAFAANGECRGSVRLTYSEPLRRHVAFLTISGKDVTNLGFRLYDTETGMEYYDAEESLDFVANAIVGTADDLYTIHFRGTTGVDELASKVQVYPNPVNAGERFSINIAEDVKGPVCVEIVNALGVETLRATSEQTPTQLTAPAVAGVYTLRITVEGKGTAVRKLVVK